MRPIRKRKSLLALAAVLGCLTTARANTDPVVEARWTPSGATFESVKFAAAPNGEALAFVDQHGTLRIWRPATNTLHQAPLGNRKLGLLSFSRDGRWLVSSTLLGELVIWDVATGVATSRFALDVNPNPHYLPASFATVDGLLLTLPDRTERAGRGYLLVNGVLTPLPRLDARCDVLYLPAVNWAVVVRDREPSSAVGWLKGNIKCSRPRKPFRIELVQVRTGKTMVTFSAPTIASESLAENGVFSDDFYVYASGDGSRLAIMSGVHEDHSLTIWSTVTGSLLVSNPEWMVSEDDSSQPWSDDGRWLAVEVEREVGRAHGLVEVEKKRFVETVGSDFIAGTNQFLGYDGKTSETVLIDPGRWKRTVLVGAGSLDSAHATSTPSGRLVGRGRVGSGTIWNTSSGERVTYAGDWTWAESTLDGKRLMTLDSRGTMTLRKMP